MSFIENNMIPQGFEDTFFVVNRFDCIPEREKPMIRRYATMKLANCIETGGMAKAVIQDGLVTVNGETCLMRGKKLYAGDSFTFEGVTYEICDK